MPQVFQPEKLTVEFDENGENPKLVVQVGGGWCYCVKLEPLAE